MHCYTPQKAIAAFPIADWISNQIIRAVSYILVSLTTFHKNRFSTLDLYRYPDNLEHYVLTRKSKSRHRPVPRARFQSPA